MTGRDEEPDEVSEIDRADHHKHMDYVQAVIARLANNSFLMKGWALTLSTALLGFAASHSQVQLALAATMPAAAFWLLDTYYLRQERAFRAMYADVARKKVPGFEMNPAPYAKRQSWRKVGRSISLSAFYGTLIVISLVVALVLASSSFGEDDAPEPYRSPAWHAPYPSSPGHGHDG